MSVISKESLGFWFEFPVWEGENRYTPSASVNESGDLRIPERTEAIRLRLAGQSETLRETKGQVKILLILYFACRKDRQSERRSEFSPPPMTIRTPGDCCLKKSSSAMKFNFPCWNHAVSEDPSGEDRTRAGRGRPLFWSKPQGV